MEGDEVQGKSAERFAPPWEYRGTDMSRILALSDGVFAFAMTLLVIELALPAYATGTGIDHYLLSARFYSAIYAYVLTFFVIGLWWQAHHLVFGYIRSYDRTLIWYNTVFLIFIAVLPFATDVLGSAGSARVGVIFFALLQVCSGLTLLVLWIHASGPKRLVPGHLPAEWTEALRVQMITSPAVFGASIVVAIFSPTAAEYVWLLLFVIVAARRRGHRTREGSAKGGARSPSAPAAPLASDRASRPTSDPPVD